MSIASRIAAKRAERDRSFVEVDEWGDDTPLKLYFTDMTARDIERIQRKHKDFLSNPTLSAMVEAIILKCEDENGDKAFSLEDKPILMGETIGVIAKVFGAVLGAVDVEDHEKN